MPETPNAAPQATPAAPVAVKAVSPGSKAPVAAVAPTAAPVAPPAEDPRLAELAKQTQRAAQEAQKLSRLRREVLAKEAEVKTQAQEFEAWKKLQTDKRRNPAKYLEADYGPQWFETVNRAKLEGGTATPELLASELDFRESRIQEQLKKQAEDFTKQLDARDAKEAQAAKAAYDAEAEGYLTSNLDKYPGIKAAGWKTHIAAYIQNHYEETCRKDESGQWVSGELLSPEAAAQGMEKYLRQIHESFKAAEAPQAATKPAVPARRTEAPTQRRTLSNDMAQDTGVPTPPRDDRERMKRAVLAMEARHAGN